MQFESYGTYLARQSYLDDQERQREEYLRQQQEASYNPNPVGRFLQNPIGALFEGLARPAQAVRTGVSAYLGGQNPLAGLLTGFTSAPGTPGVPENMAEILERQGMGTRPVGPFDTRGIVGFGLDVATDPTSLIPFGKLAGIAGQVGRTVLPQAAQHALPMVPRGLEVADVLKTGFRPTALQAGAQAATRIPVLGGILERTLNVISPSILAPPGIDRSLIAFSRVLEDNGNRMDAAAARFVARPMTTPIGEDARILFPDGTRQAWSDVFQHPDAFTFDRTGNRLLSDADLSYIKDQQQFYREQRAMWEEHYDLLRAVAPETAKSFKLVDAALEPGEEFVSRIAIRPEGTVVPVRRIGATVGGRRGIQFERAPQTAEQLMEKGVQYVADPLEVLRIRGADVLAKVAQMDFARALVQDTGYIEGLAGIEAAGLHLVQVRGYVQELRGFQGLLARAARGEDVPGASLEKYRETMPDLVLQVERLGARPVGRPPGPVPFEQQYFPAPPPQPTAFGTVQRMVPMPVAGHLPEFQLRAAARTSEFRQVQGQLADLLETATDAMREASRYRRGLIAGERAATAMAGLKTVGTPILRGLWFSPEDAQALGSALSAQAHPILQFAANLGAVSRTLQTGFDLGAGFIQGLPTLARDPVLWLRGQAHAVSALLGGPERHAAFLADDATREVLNRYPGLSVAGRHYETAALGQGQWLTRGLEALPGGVGQPVEFAARRGQAAFEAQGDFLRVKLAEALGPTYERAGRIPELVDLVNHMTGVFSLRAAGIGPGQRALESGALWFSAQYLRSVLALSGDVLGGGLIGRDAAHALADLAVVGYVGYTRLAQMMGQAPVLDPNDGRFFTVGVAGQRVGIGSAWVALARLTGALASNPSGVLNVEDLGQNPLFRFWKGRTSPVAGAVLDALDQETFGGQPVRNVREFGQAELQRFTPFGIAAGLEGGSRGGAAGATAQVASSLLGLRGFPESQRGAMDRIAREQFGKQWDELTPIEQGQVRASPEVQAIPQPQGEKFERTRALADIYTRYRDELETRAQQFTAGQITASQFRQAELGLKAERTTRADQLAPGPVKEAPPGSPEASYQQYVATLKAEDQFGRRDPEAIDQFLASLPPAHQQYIRDRAEAQLSGLGSESRGLMQELRAARATLQPYWQIQTEELARVGLADRWREATPAERTALEATPQYRAAVARADRKKEQLRRQNPEIDQALVLWYGRVPIREHRR